MAFAAALLLARGAPLLLLRWSARAPRAGAGAAALGAARRHLSALSTADDLPPPAPPPHVDGGVGAPLGAKGPAPPSLSKAWADEPGFRRWKDKEAEILSDIGPIIALTKNILHSNRYRDGEHLSAEDQKAVVEKLLAYHPHSEDKIGCGLNSVMRLMQGFSIHWSTDIHNSDIQGASLLYEMTVAGSISHTRNVFEHTSERSIHLTQRGLSENISNGTEGEVKPVLGVLVMASILSAAAPRTIFLLPPQPDVPPSSSSSSSSSSVSLSALHDRMRWARAHPHSLLRRSNPHHLHLLLHPIATISTISLSAELSLTESLVSLLHSLPLSSPLDPSLSVLSPLLTPHVVSAALLASSPVPSLRLFLWASRRPRLRSWPSHARVVSLLRSDPSALAAMWALLPSAAPVPPPAFAALIAALAAAGAPDKAVEAFARMPDFGARPNTFVFNTLLRALVRSGVVLLAMAVYNRMIKSDCRPNRATYNILMDGLCKAGMADDALALFDEMLGRGIPPNTAIYTVFLSSLCKAGKLDEASGLLHSMRRKGCGPDAVTYNALLSGFCKLGRIDEAFQHLESFREEGGFVLGLSGYSCLIDGLFRVGRFDEACRHYGEMLERNVAPDVVLYTIMIRGHAEAGRIEDAFAFLGEMSNRGLVPDTFCYNTLIKGLCDAGYLDRARSLRLEISQNDRFPDSATYTIMICGLCKEGLVHEAQQIFDEMGKLGCYPTVMTFNALINGFCKAGKLEEARILFYKMEMGRNPSLFLRLSHGANQVRDSESLRRLVEEMCQSGLVLKAYKLLRGIIDSGVVPDVVTYNILINGLCKVGNPDGALKLFKELQMKGHSPDAVTYGTLIDGLMKAHREDDAFMVFQHILRGGSTPSLSIYSTLMRTLCRKKRISQAVNLWLNYLSQQCQNPQEAGVVAAVRKHFEDGELEEVIRGLIDMDRKHGSVRPFPYTIWLIGFCQARKVEDALRIFNILRELDIDVTPPSCVLLINCLCRTRDLSSALDVMLYALRKGFNFMQPVGNRLLKRLCVDNRKQAAKALAWRMHLAGYDMDAYLRETTKVLLYNH
ncbi:Pentatricopeptide repeat-containing protein [Ananas comosus]|uniref:Pentatricopeptide repeat-containing protein n=1 Tax=Ananas comosus TaxID=4615 RepID=A0A199VDH1_ANACO|nr:Pentatricopeptide repeat-containing protein [Ananas comosus]